MASLDTLKKDELFQSEKVYSLGKCGFEKFIDTKDVVLVMFYKAQDMKQRVFFSKAAGVTCKLNHAYASVNCDKEADLCLAQKVCKFPTYKLYQKTSVIGKLSAVKDFSALRDLVETAPKPKKAGCKSG